LAALFFCQTEFPRPLFINENDPLPYLDPVFSPNGRQVLTARRSGEEIRLWDVTREAERSRFVQHEAPITSAAFNRTGSLLATGSEDGTARIWSAATGTLERSISHPPEVSGVAFSSDYRYIVTAGTDKTARIWDVATGEAVGEPLRHDEEVVYVAFTSDNRRIATVSSDVPHSQKGRLWEATSGKPVSSHLLQSLLRGGMFSAVAFSPDGRRVVTVRSNDLETALVRDVTTGEEVVPPLKHSRHITLVNFSSEGGRILTTVELEALIWDAASGKPATPPLTHGTFIDHADFSPDGRLVVTTSEDHDSVRLWDATTGEAVVPLLPSKSPRIAVFSPDVRFMVLLGQGSEKAEMWHLIREDRPVQDLELLAQVLTAHRIDDTGGYVPLEGNELEQGWQKLRAIYP
jgi:WD40 repeat protein